MKERHANMKAMNKGREIPFAKDKDPRNMDDPETAESTMYVDNAAGFDVTGDAYAQNIYAQREKALPKLFIDGKCKGGIGSCLEAESNNDLFNWLDEAKVKYVKG